MMPSRGILRAQRDAPRLFQLQCRNLSSATRRIPQTSIHLRNHPSSSLRSQRWQAPISSVNTARHASSWWPFGNSEPPAPPVESIMTPATPASQPQAPPPADASTASTTSTPSATPPPIETPESVATATVDSTAATEPNIDTLTIDTPDIVAGVPDTIGYLKSLGLDYGWGPTSILQWFVEHFHVWGGLPWWGAIAATSIVLRLVLLPFYFKSSDLMARQTALVSVTKPITDRMQEARKRGDHAEMQKAYHQFRAVRRQAGISMPRQFAPMLVQGIFGYCGFKLLRAAATLPVPAFKYDGFLWLQDLTVPDPYLVLPVAMAGVLHFLVRIGGETGAAASNQMTPGIRNFMLYGVPVAVVFGTGWLPGAVAVWFAAGGLLGVAQSLLLRQPKVRNFLGISQMYQPPKGQDNGANAFSGLRERFGPRKNNNVIDVKAKVKDAPAATAATGTGKNDVFMRPTYQRPNLRFTSPARASSNDSSQPTQTSSQLPASSSESKDDMIPPSGKASESSLPGGAGGVLDKASQAWQRGRDLAQGRVKDYLETRDAETGDVEERMRKRKKDVDVERNVMYKRNEEYEKRKKAKKGEKKPGS